MFICVEINDMYNIWLQNLRIQTDWSQPLPSLLPLALILFILTPGFLLALPTGRNICTSLLQTLVLQTRTTKVMTPVWRLRMSSNSLSSKIWLLRLEWERPEEITSRTQGRPGGKHCTIFKHNSASTHDEEDLEDHKDVARGCIANIAVSYALDVIPVFDEKVAGDDKAYWVGDNNDRDDEVQVEELGAGEKGRVFVVLSPQEAGEATHVWQDPGARAKTGK